MKALILSSTCLILLTFSSADLYAQDSRNTENKSEAAKNETLAYEAAHVSQYRFEYMSYIAAGGSLSLEEFSGLNYLRSLETPWRQRKPEDVSKFQISAWADLKMERPDEESSVQLINDYIAFVSAYNKLKKEFSAHNELFNPGSKGRSVAREPETASESSAEEILKQLESQSPLQKMEMDIAKRGLEANKNQEIESKTSERRADVREKEKDSKNLRVRKE